MSTETTTGIATQKKESAGEMRQRPLTIVWPEHPNILGALEASLAIDKKPSSMRASVFAMTKSEAILANEALRAQDGLPNKTLTWEEWDALLTDLARAYKACGVMYRPEQKSLFMGSFSTLKRLVVDAAPDIEMWRGAIEETQKKLAQLKRRRLAMDADIDATERRIKELAE